MKRCFIRLGTVQGWGEGSTYRIAAQRAVADAVRKLPVLDNAEFSASFTFQSSLTQLVVTRTQVIK